jgi:hypothetical protein
MSRVVVGIFASATQMLSAGGTVYTTIKVQSAKEFVIKYNPDDKAGNNIQNWGTYTDGIGYDIHHKEYIQRGLMGVENEYTLPNGSTPFYIGWIDNAVKQNMDFTIDHPKGTFFGDFRIGFDGSFSMTRDAGGNASKWAFANGVFSLID